MRVTIIALTLLATPAFAQHRAYEAASSPKDLLGRWARENGACRGSPDASVSGPACRRRDQIDRQLTGLGWCFGREGQIMAQYEWHRCDARSAR